MRAFLMTILLAACGGASQQQLASTPTAQSKAFTGEAPAASTSDKDREHEINAMDDMQKAQQAQREANQAPATAPPPPLPPDAPPAPPAKKKK